MLRILMLLVLLVGCASERTKYAKYSKKNGGYQDKTVENNLRVVSFKANSYTPVKLAIKFAKFRAIEICQKEEYKVAHLLDTFDKTQSKTVTRTSSSGYPSYYYGMSPFYSRYSGFGYGFGFSTMNSSSWNETVQYPDIEVIFQCTNEVWEPEVKFREVPPDEMKHLVKDLKGGLQVESVPETSVSKKNVKVGDVIIEGNGERIQQTYQLLTLFINSKDHTINVEVLRDGNLKQGLILKGTKGTDKLLKAQKDIVKSTCKNKELAENKLCQK